ncbi:unnamed protein product [Linum tenue]|uniref:Glycosyltransferase n=2 Tax=Linum tenue TaxID=586396 RepID=A0AAV0RIG0_9ROSI|nr:unnamed protein product [Linum tenue]
MANSTDRLLHVYFFPFLAHGHLIPTVDMAKLFAGRGVKTTIVTTPLNAPNFSATTTTGPDIQTRLIDFPAAEFGLPAECQNLEFISAHNKGWEGVSQFTRAAVALREPFEKLLEQDRPDCLVADMLFPWATESAAKFGIPRLIFHGTSFFALAAGDAVATHEPQNRVSSDDESFVIPGLPDEVRFTRRQLPSRQTTGNNTLKFFKRVGESSSECFGTVVNSFYELEPAYADHYRRVLGRRSWHVGPVSLCNADDRAVRGKEATIGRDECLKWLDSKEPNTVVYVSFGSIVKFSAEQMREIAIGIEASECQFIWVVRECHQEDDGNNWLPEGFEDRTSGRGMIIRGWAPQVLILDHAAIGALVTHYGWNSTLEGITAGLPMVTWPVMADQFYNEKLVTEVVRIGVSVGGREWSVDGGGTVGHAAVESALRRVMSREVEEVMGMHRRAKALGEMARKAVEEGGSSYFDLSALIEELRSQT